MDLLDLWRDNDRLSWRKLGVLVQHLPPESATAARLRVDALNDPQGEQLGARSLEEIEGEHWSRNDFLVAAVRDELHLLRWLYSYAHNGGKRPKWEPELLERPGVSSSRKKPPPTTAQTSLLARHLALTQAVSENVTYN